MGLSSSAGASRCPGARLPTTTDGGSKKKQQLTHITTVPVPARRQALKKLRRWRRGVRLGGSSHVSVSSRESQCYLGFNQHAPAKNIYKNESLTEFAFLFVCFFNVNVSSSARQLSGTHFILVPPLLPLPTTCPPFPSPYPPTPTAPISVCRHAPVSPIRKGNEARIQMQIY